NVILRNTICTHGNINAIAGAVFHGLCLWHARRTGRLPGPAEWQDFSAEITRLPAVVERDADLLMFWLPTWETATEQSFEQTCQQMDRDLRIDITKLDTLLSRANNEVTYRLALHEL